MRTKSAVFAGLNRRVLPLLAACAARVLPAKLWYRAAFGLSGLMRGEPLERARLLNRCLALLTRTGREFPIPWKATGMEVLAGRGVILCSAHVPLIKVPLRAMVESGFAIAAAIAAEPGEDGKIALWGLRERLPALRVQPDVLIRARTVLREGGRIVMLADHEPGADLSSNIFRLAGKIEAKVVFFFAELQLDGCVAVRFELPPDPFCRSAAGIQANLNALDSEVKRILRQDRVGNIGHGSHSGEEKSIWPPINADSRR